MGKKCCNKFVCLCLFIYFMEPVSTNFKQIDSKQIVKLKLNKKWKLSKLYQLSLIRKILNWFSDSKYSSQMKNKMKNNDTNNKKKGKEENKEAGIK